MNFLKLRGKRIKSIRGFQNKKDKRVKYPNVDIQYILFDDETTIMEFEEQDCHTYHDFSFCARDINVVQNKVKWKKIYSNLKNFPVSTINFDGTNLNPRKKRRSQ